MFQKICLLLAAVSVVFGAGDPWAKVRDIKSGTELRIYKRGVKQPVLAKMDEATDERLIIALKEEQTSIAKEDIDRVDARPAQTGSRIVKETKTTTTAPNHSASPRDNVGGSAMPGTSTSSGLSIGGKPDFETVYRRVTPPPAK
jgi:hypothetical protein